jgi:integral membrane protein (TIGR00529 family)
MPPILTILLVFAATLALTRIKVPLGLALMLGGIALNAFAGRPAMAIAESLGAAFSTSELWMFVAIVALIIEIGRYMTEEDNSRELVAAAHRWGGRHGRAFSLAAIPAVIGLVPMPAGAIFSAPFVARAGEPIRDAADWKAAVNYWFRHVWEYWWPLYPGVIVAMSLFDIPTWRFVLGQLPCTVVSLAAGYFFLIRPHLAPLAAAPADTAGSRSRALVLMLPITLVFAAMFLAPFALKIAAPHLGLQTGKMVSILLGLAVALAVVAWDEHRAGHHRMFATLFKKRSIDVLTSLVGVLVFKAMLDRSGLLPGASADLLRSGMPTFLAVALLPFLAGMVTGLAVGFVATSLPLVVGLLHAPGSGLTPSATLMLAYGAGYLGMMLSPIHLCLIVSQDYFSSNLRAVYRQILPCVLAVAVFCFAAFFLFSRLGW